jgi:hypothetical protein
MEAQVSSSDDLDDFLREARSWDDPRDATGAALKQRLDRRIAAAAALATSTASVSAPPPRTFPFGRAASAAGIACIAAVVFQFGSGAVSNPPPSGVASADVGRETPRVEPVPTPQPEPASQTGIESGAPSPSRSVDVRDLPNASDSPNVRDWPKRPNAAPVDGDRNARVSPDRDATDDSLEEETRLLRAARTARLTGAPERSLALTNEHAARFPSGALAPERDAERISALCALGRGDEARRNIGLFEARWPASSLLERVRTSCRGIP